MLGVATEKARLGAIQVLRNAFFWKLETPTHPLVTQITLNLNTFVTLFSGKSDTPPHPHLRYVTLEWPLTTIWFSSGEQKGAVRYTIRVFLGC